MSLYVTRKATTFIAIHCSATPTTMNIGVKEVRQWHRAKGWIDVGYHFIIRRDGTVELGRPVDTVGAHVEGYNPTSIGICLIGGVDKNNKAEDNFTAEQYAALKRLLTDLQQAYPNAAVQGHRDFPNVKKDCPCFDVRAWVKAGSPALSVKPKTKTPKTVTVSAKLATFYAISRAYGVTVEALQKANPKVDPQRLKIGQRLNLS